jgi:hypothetical protein
VPRRSQDKLSQFERTSQAKSIMAGQGLELQMAKDIVISLSVTMAKKMNILPRAWSDEKILFALHKLRYEMPQAPDDKRHESRRWLEQRGMHRWQMQPWPPEGELPK